VQENGEEGGDNARDARQFRADSPRKIIIFASHFDHFRRLTSGPADVGQ
jgi:hypothetical protein